MSEERPRQKLRHSWVKKISQFFWQPKDLDSLVDVLRDASNADILDAQTLSIAEGALSVSQMRARDVMIPRTQVVMVSHDASVEDTVSQIIESAHSRFPVIDDDRDDIIGILLAKDVLAAFVESKKFDFNINGLLRPPMFIPESKRLNVLLREFRNHRNHMAIVVDEYGGVAGIVTIENVLEQIVGEIDDEHDPDDDVVIFQRNDNTFVVKAITTVEAFNERFASDWSNQDFDTIGGYVTNQFGYMPERDEEIAIDRFKFKVIKADSRRVYLFEMSVLENTEPEQEDTQS